VGARGGGQQEGRSADRVIRPVGPRDGQIAHRQPVPGQKLLDQHGRVTGIADPPFEPVDRSTATCTLVAGSRQPVTLRNRAQPDDRFERTHPKGRFSPFHAVTCSEMYRSAG
jgi:hypothetical protein